MRTTSKATIPIEESEAQYGSKHPDTLPFYSFLVSGLPGLGSDSRWGSCGLRSLPLDLTDHPNYCQTQSGGRVSQEPHHSPGFSWTHGAGTPWGRCRAAPPGSPSGSTATPGPPGWGVEGGAVWRAQPLPPQSGLRGAHSPTVPFPFPIRRGPTPPSQVRRTTPPPQVYPKAPSPRTRVPLTPHRASTHRRRRRPQRVLTRRTRPRTTLSVARVLAARPRLYISRAKRAGSSSSGDSSSQACAPAARGSLGAGAAPGSSPKSNSSCSQGAMARAKPASRPHALTDARPNRPG